MGDMAVMYKFVWPCLPGEEGGKNEVGYVFREMFVWLQKHQVLAGFFFKKIKKSGGFVVRRTLMARNYTGPVLVS